MEEINPFRDQLKRMSDQEVLAAIHNEREARLMERLELAFEESKRRCLWAVKQPRYYRRGWR